MKNVLTYLILLLMSFYSLSAYAQSNDEPEALGLPGDNFNLYAVLDVFQKSKTLEDFEKAINDESGKFNNLDLNNDNSIDYIQVLSEKNGDSFFVVLQTEINQFEKQDIAVIEVSKNKNNQVFLQIIGDEDLYGKNYVVEPSRVTKASSTPNPGYNGGGTVIINNNTINNYDRIAPVSSWPVVMYFYSSMFLPWHSPWYWGNYPSYWRPWRPVFYYNYWGYHRHYYSNIYYHRTVIIRNPGHKYYYSNRRSTSVVVRNNSVNGRYITTYNGKTYRKPVISTRPTNVNRPSVNRPAQRPSVYPNGSNKGIKRPHERPIHKSPETSRPTKPSVRPSAPTQLPATRPVNKPTNTNRGGNGR